MTNKIEKGQKYKSGEYTFTILSEVFEGPDGVGRVAYVDSVDDGVMTTLASHFEDSSEYTLIREPKFKVGDRVDYYSDSYKIVAVSPEPDKDGDFGYLAVNLSEGYFESLDDSYSLKAAE